MASSLTSLTSGFFPSNNHDRLYTADQLGNVISSLISDGIIQSSGADKNTVPFRATFSGSDNTAVTINKGLAWLKNTWSSNVAMASLSMSDTVAIDAAGNRRTNGSPANNSNPRWDAIAIEVNKTASVRSNTFVVVEGTPGSSPSKPDSHSYDSAEEGRYYYTIAYVYRPAGSGNVITNQTSDKLIVMVGQNGGTPWVTSLVSEATSIDNLMEYWRDNVNAKIADMDRAISQAGQHQLVDGAVTTAKIANSAVTGAKIANGTIGSGKLSFSTVELTQSGKVPANNASSLISTITASMSLTLSNAGCTMSVDSTGAVAITLPSTVAWAAGTEMEFIRWNAGSVTINASGNTKFYIPDRGEVTTFTIGNRYGAVVIKMMASNKWVVAGDIG